VSGLTAAGPDLVLNEDGLVLHVPTLTWLATPPLNDLPDFGQSVAIADGQVFVWGGFTWDSGDAPVLSDRGWTWAAHVDTATGNAPDGVDDDAAGSGPGSTFPDDWTEEEIAAYEVLLRQQAAGWVPFGGSGYADYEVPDEAWIAHPQIEDPVEHRFAVHDEPNGLIVGYAYPGLGYVPAGVADSPAFDAAARRIERYGCDAQEDRSCPG
jgi:hypothetical protein